MSRRLERRALLVAALALASLGYPALTSDAAHTPGGTNENSHTLLVSLPGPFSGCTYLDQAATASDDALNDLVTPSAFTTLPTGVLVGAGGPIASAELTSLSPETVRYTVAPHQRWSDGRPFTAHDLVDWWRRARQLSSVASDGYRAIASMRVSNHGRSATAVFAHPYSTWTLLFRDVEAPRASAGCSIAAFAARPTLGPYEVRSATPTRVVLVMNPHWPLDPNRFGRVVVTTSRTLPKRSTTLYAGFSTTVNQAEVLATTSDPAVQSRIGSASGIEELTLSPRSPTTAPIAVREALSWAIARQGLIGTIYGAYTYEPAAAQSALYSQGQAQYPGFGGTNPSNTTTTTTIPDATTNGLHDCPACAVQVLTANGYAQGAHAWFTPQGKRLVVRLAIGPSHLDHSVAYFIERDWARLGIQSASVPEPTEVATAQAVAAGRADAGVLVRPTIEGPSYTARSFVGPAYPDTYPSGVRLAGVIDLYNTAIANFNPATATSSWLNLDRDVMNLFWVRPLFTPPSLEVWSTQLSVVAQTFSAPSFLDQVPTWTVLPPATTGS
ncbi:MAG TPA: ABC transporter substrate-binding protein [Acidimicrobiales bacterium]|nr:MAG: hypothetical protein B7Z69_07910 [Actinobacteria bacterium 21-73-9]HQU26782.1 ABC transporter substrate-binding protein [Acidimicrobiales bacterium]